MKNYLLLAFLFCFLKLTAQDCTFDPYQKKGGLFYFSTFYQNYDPKQVREGVCQKIANGKPYEYREFKNGQLQVERLYNFETGEVYSEFKRVKKDSVIAQLVYKNQGNKLELKKTFYLDKNKKRCWREENYRNGVLYSVHYYRNLTHQEIIDAGYAKRPDHVIDGDGYCDVSVLFGPELTYHPNGKIQSIKHHEFIITDYPSLTHTQTGLYIMYAENGVEIQRGNYKDGQPWGEFIYHFPNGKLASKRYFENGISVGNWVEYYEDGTLWITINYGDAYYWPTGHEKRYSKTGQLIYEKVIAKNGVGYHHEFFDNGQWKEKTLFEHGPNERTAFYQWYPSGQLKQKIFLRPQNDTLSAQFYEDGWPQSISIYKPAEQYSENRSYYTNHQLFTHVISSRESEKLFHDNKQYAQNGVLLLRTMISDKERSNFAFWPNGKLKSEKHYLKDTLQGWWIEQDSSGIVQKKCHYSGGFRDTTCLVSKPQVLQPLEPGLRKAVLPITITALSRNLSQKPLILTKKDVEMRADLLKRTLEYLMTEQPNFQLQVVKDSIDEFRYQLSMSESVYKQHEQKIDSVLDLLNLKKRFSRNGGGFIYQSYRGSNYYNGPWIDSVFQSVLPQFSGYLQLERSNVVTYDMDDKWVYGRQNTVLFEYIMAKQIWIVTVNGTPVVHYADGSMEVFNGYDVPAVQEYLLQNHMRWE
jgi:antitoxin component YwqK of YwqJK toxin-antitoxin module